MTLAVIFLFGLFGANAAALPRAVSPAQSTEQAAPESAPSGSQQQDQKTGTPSSESKPASPHSQVTNKPSASQVGKRTHKKRPATSDCAAAPAISATKSSPDAKPSASPAAAGDSAQASKSGDPPKNCPPQKIVVRHGGTAEPSIQLAGGPATGQSSQQKNAAIQLLGSTEENLKKLSGRQLSSDQQDTVTQIHQFMQQSKAAAANGDSERARTLAWKAELLSEDLVNPQK
ncbi:MAG: hypothetical protein WCF26_15860 [Candidatus Sulfotelmatobacter sp.]